MSLTNTNTLPLGRPRLGSRIQAGHLNILRTSRKVHERASPLSPRHAVYNIVVEGAQLGLHWMVTAPDISDEMLDSTKNIQIRVTPHDLGDENSINFAEYLWSMSTSISVLDWDERNEVEESVTTEFTGQTMSAIHAMSFLRPLSPTSGIG